MIEILHFKKRQDLNRLMNRFPDIYAVESEVSNALIYGISDGKFAIFRSDGAVLCPLHQTPELASKIKYSEVKDEVLKIYDDYKQLSKLNILIG